MRFLNVCCVCALAEINCQNVLFRFKNSSGGGPVPYWTDWPGLIKRFYHPRSLVMQPSKRIKKTTKTNLMDKDYNFHKTQLKEIETTSTNCNRTLTRKSQSRPVLLSHCRGCRLFTNLWVVTVLCDPGWTYCHHQPTWTKNRQCLKDRFLLTFEHNCWREFVRFCGEATQWTEHKMVPFLLLILLRFWKIAENSLSFWSLLPAVALTRTGVGVFFRFYVNFIRLITKLCKVAF